MPKVRRTMAIVSGVALAAALAFAFAGHGVPTAASREPTSHVVHVQGMVFRPQTLEIAAGDSVTWINDDMVPHAIKSTHPNQSWQSPDLPLHGSWTKEFRARSTYVCPYHPTMTGEILISAD